MPEIFSPEINWINPLVEEHEYETTIFRTKADFDQRQSLADIPHRRLTYTISAMDHREGARLEALIRKVQGEPCYVPYWRGARYMTAAPEFVAGGKTRIWISNPGGAGFEVDNYLMLFRGPHLVLVSKIYKVLSDQVQINDVITTGDWPVKGTKVVPAFLGQLAPEVDLDYVERSLKQVPVTFDLHPYERVLSADCNWSFVESFLNPLNLKWEIDPTGGPSGGPALKVTIPPDSRDVHISIDNPHAFVRVIGLPITDPIHTYVYSLEAKVKTDWNIGAVSSLDGKPGIRLGPCLTFVPATSLAFNAWQTLNTSCDTFSGTGPDREFIIEMSISQGTSELVPHTVWFAEIILRDEDGNVVHTCLPNVPGGVPGATPIFSPLSALHRPGQSLQKPVRKLTQLQSPGGVFSVRPHFADPLTEHQLDLVFFNSDDWYAFRAFHDLVQGAFGAFWVPSYQQDLVSLATIGAADVEFDIQDIGYTDLYFPSLSRRQIAFVRADGSFLKRTIVNATDNGDGTETLEINESLGNSFTQSNANGICFLWYGRFSDDAARTDWLDTDQANISIAMIELRDPPDGGSGDSADGFLLDEAP